MTEETTEDYVPAFSLSAEGKDITKALQASLLQLTLTDNGGATGKADELKITLLSETLKLPTKGARLRLALGFNNQLTDKGWFVVSGVGSSGPPRRIDIAATAAPMNAQKHTGNVTSQKTRHWDNITLGDLVKTVATDNGLIPRVAEKLAPVRIEHLDQVAESDANLMTRVARTYDAVSKPSGGYWLFLPQGAAQTASGKTLPAVTITPGDVSSWSYSEGSRGNSTGNAKKSKIGVRYYDEVDGRTKTTTVDHDGPSMTSPYTQSHKTVADNQAKSKKTQAGRNEKKMTLTGPCRLRHIQLMAEGRVKTSGFGEREDQDWLIESLVFSLTSRGLSFTYNLVMDIKRKAGKKKDSKKAGPDYFGSSSS